MPGCIAAHSRDAQVGGSCRLQLLSFPQGRHDDIVDSIMQALAFKMTSYDETLSWVG